MHAFRLAAVLSTEGASSVFTQFASKSVSHMPMVPNRDCKVVDEHVSRCAQYA